MDESVLDAGGELRGVLKGCFVDHLGGIEDDDVRVSANLQTPLLLESRRAFLEPLRGPESALLQREHEWQIFVFTDILAENARVAAGVARVAHEAIAGNHRVWAGDNLADKALGVGMHDNFATLLAVFLKRRFR